MFRAAMLAVFLAGFLTGQQPVEADAVVEIPFRAEPGTVLEYDLWFSDEGSPVTGPLAGGPIDRGKLAYTAEITLTVVRCDAAGVDLKLVLTGIRGEFDTPPDGSLPLDSDGPGPEAHFDRNRHLYFTAVAGHEFLVTLDRRGRVEKIGGSEAIAEKLGPETSSLILDAVSPKQLAKLAQLLFVQLPEADKATAKAWRAEKSLDLGALHALCATLPVKSSLSFIEDTLAYIESTGEVPAGAAESPEPRRTWPKTWSEVRAQIRWRGTILLKDGFPWRIAIRATSERPARPSAPRETRTVRVDVQRWDSTLLDTWMADLRSSDPEDREYALGCLAAAQFRAAPVVPALLALLESEDAKLKDVTLRALGGVAGAALEACPRILASTTEGEPPLRCAALATVTKIIEAAEVSARSHARRAGATTAAARARFLGQWHEQIASGAAAAVASSITAMESPDRDLKLEAARCLGHLAPHAKSAIPGLSRCAAAEDPELQGMAVWALACIGPEGPDAVPVLVGALASEDFSTRANACMALEHIGSAAAPALEALVGRLEDPDLRVRAAAVRALAAMGPAASEAREALEKAGASNGDPEFKAEIARALEAIGP